MTINHLTDFFKSFSAVRIQTKGATIFVRHYGSGPPILLLHGFPQTHLMWRNIAPLLAQDFTVVCADLRGYGQSSCPPSASDHAPYAKRAMAEDMVQVMEHFGFKRFMAVGHDRGGRVAYRLALDYPERVTKMAVLDILPAETAWELADDRLALSFWPWSLLAQPEPLPERILQTAAEAIIDDALNEWGSSAKAFSSDVRLAYVQALQDPKHAHAICEEYRAAADTDRRHDRADQQNARRITCPALVLWAAAGPLDIWYQKQSGPLALWRQWADDVQGQPVKGGHFFPEEAPRPLARLLSRFASGKSIH